MTNMSVHVATGSMLSPSSAIVKGAAAYLFEAWGRVIPTGANTVAWLEICSRTVSTRSWVPFDRADVPEEELRSVTELLDNIRKAFGLSIKALAAVLGVERPTIYAWLKGSINLRPENSNRLAAVAALADEWLMNALDSDGRRIPSPQLIEALATNEPDYVAIAGQLRQEAAQSALTAREEFAQKVAKLPVRGSAFDFDVMTQRPLGPSLLS